MHDAPPASSPETPAESLSDTLAQTLAKTLIESLTAEGGAGGEDLGGEAVGYCRPPVHAQFRKGQSGNPLGRPRGAGSRPRKPSASAPSGDIERALRRRVEITINGRRRRVGLTQALISRLTDKALAGEVVALRELLRLCAETEAARTARVAKEADESIFRVIRMCDPSDRNLSVDDLSTDAMSRLLHLAMDLEV